MRLRLIVLMAALGLSVSAFGQAGASRGTATSMIGGKPVTIEYGRPVLKGRDFQDLMKKLPADRMWRAGSGRITILDTGTPLMIGGKRVAAGRYSVYVHCPEQGNFSLVLNSDLGMPLGKVWAAAPPAQAGELYPHFEYAKEIADKEVARAPLMKVPARGVEQLTYELLASAGGAQLKLSWGNQAWVVELLAAR